MDSNQNITLGYPSSQNQRQKVRKKMDDICYYNQYR